jgi:hypothetical protein
MGLASAAFPGAAMRPTRAEYGRILELYRESNEAVCRAYFPERAELFGPRTKFEEEGAESANRDRAMQVLCAELQRSLRT